MMHIDMMYKCAIPPLRTGQVQRRTKVQGCDAKNDATKNCSWAQKKFLPLIFNLKIIPMRKYFFLLFVMFAAAFNCMAQGSDEAAVRRLMDEQVTAWNSGDIDAFMQGYWKSDSLLFVGGKGHLWLANNFGWLQKKIPRHCNDG